MPVYLKKTEFAPAGVQAGSPSRTFHPEVTGAGGKIQSKNYTGWNANSYINNDLMPTFQHPRNSLWQARIFSGKTCCIDNCPLKDNSTEYPFWHTVK